jgi:hypothetical protein
MVVAWKVMALRLLWSTGQNRAATKISPGGDVEFNSTRTVKALLLGLCLVATLALQ